MNKYSVVMVFVSSILTLQQKYKYKIMNKIVNLDKLYKGNSTKFVITKLKNGKYIQK